jgi:hypothetical protein
MNLKHRVLGVSVGPRVFHGSVSAGRCGCCSGN